MQHQVSTNFKEGSLQYAVGKPTCLLNYGNSTYDVIMLISFALTLFFSSKREMPRPMHNT